MCQTQKGNTVKFKIKPINLNAKKKGLWVGCGVEIVKSAKVFHTDISFVPLKSLSSWLLSHRSAKA